MFEGITVFNTVEASKLETLSALAQTRFLTKGEFLFEQGDDAIAIYIIQDGIIDFFKDNVYFGKMIQNTIFGEKAFTKGFSKRLLSAKAEIDSILIVILYEDFTGFLKKYPEYSEPIHNYFSKYTVSKKIIQ